MEIKKKYVIVLAHADGWGALSTNKLMQHLKQAHPEIDVYLVVSQATKNKEGSIATKLNDLRNSRELKETNLLEYFKQIDTMYESGTPLPATDLLTFKQLAIQHCADGQVHYTTRGGPKGGEEVAALVAELEKSRGGPEVLLSVDTMAILPGDLLKKYPCFSTHPGPLDTIKIEGMQGTLRSLANQILYDKDGNPLPASHRLGMGGTAYVKGTLFLQHPELDKGPPVTTAMAYVCPGMCAYQTRDELYHALVQKMEELLPTLIDESKRDALIAKVTREKEALDLKPHHRVGELDEGQLATWQSHAIGVADPTKSWGVDVIQNAVVDPRYFMNQMRRFFPGDDNAFTIAFDRIFGDAVKRLAAQQDRHLNEPWARLMGGDPDITIERINPKTGEVAESFHNRGKGGIPRGYF